MYLMRFINPELNVHVLNLDNAKHLVISSTVENRQDFFLIQKQDRHVFVMQIHMFKKCLPNFNHKMLIF